MEPEDGLIWVYSAEHPEGTMAFSDYGVDSLREIIQCHRNNNRSLTAVLAGLRAEKSDMQSID